MGEGAAHRDPRPGLEGTRVPGTGQGAARLPETAREMVMRTRASRCRQLGATGMNNLPALWTRLNNRKRRARGRGLFWTGPDAATGIYGSDVCTS